jgi:hypothetical protein
MSELLEWVSNWSGLEESHRIDPHVLCNGSWGEEGFWFIVTDDGWYGSFIAQYQRVLAPEQLHEAALLIRRIGPRHPHFFHFECRDDLGLVRGVFRLPASEPRLEDDVPVAICTLEEEWATLLPFLRRIAAGESADVMIAEAKKAFAEIDARHPKDELPEILTRPDPWAHN